MTLPPRNTTGAANVHEARTTLGRRLRELRLQAGLTGTQLAESLSWPQSKVSKLETARQTPSADDIRAWTRTTGRDSQTDELLTALETLEAQHAEWQRVLTVGLQPHQRKLSELDAKTRLFRVFESTVIPGLLQTAEYAKARLAQGVILHGASNDIDEAVRARLSRQELLYRESKRFHFVITESALRLRLCSPNAMLPQLDRLMSLSTLPNVRIGIINAGTSYTIGPWHGFWLRDNEQVLVETFSAELNLVQAPEVALYGRVFEQFATMASYDRAARSIITQVADELAAEISAEGE
ncbi:helix-turn-helix protein [Tamaricihabitans halophyticus]|uniref:Helix-turn-helix protein n=1 Tax=Tamaricihabitans halophyticus TaxID=1262583 RepID=A0A4R2R4I9_9PSEU|nr:helix-turn-helix transcriptional regulator [Tamaricihabitans halophyticus]TCP57493.1 helix-turn-helix protein [Tamaricihabitans halophyticus]